MELAHSLLLNEEALKEVPENKRSIFIYEWLRFLEKVLSAAQKADIKEKQGKLIEQLVDQLLCGHGPPTRHLIGSCLATLYTVGDSYASYNTVSKCNDVIRSKDDSPSYLPIRLAAIECLGSLYERIGRMLGGLFQETVTVLNKGLKNAESQARAETMITLKKILIGLGSSASISHRDIYKAARLGLIDRSMAVRTVAAECLRELVEEASFLYSVEFDQLSQQCFRALDGTTYEARCSIARLLGSVMAGSQQTKLLVTKGRKPTLDEVLNTLAGGFMQGGPGGRSTSGPKDFLKGGTSTTRSVRIGVTEAYVEMVQCLGPSWLERNLAVFLKRVLELVSHQKAIPSHVESVYSRRCVVFILRSTVGRMLGEKQQRTAAKELCAIITEQMNQIDIAIHDNGGNYSSDVSPTQHLLVCACHELACLVKSLGTSAAPLVAEPQSNIIEPVVSVLLHPSQAARLAASWCLRCIASALPSQLSPLIDRCADRIRALKSSGEAVSGFSSAFAALLGAVCESPMGIPHAKGKVVFNVAEELLRSAGQNTHLSLYRTQAGWLLIGALMTLGSAIVRHHTTKLLLFWRTAFPRSMRELDQEKQRGDSFTWQLTLEARSGALCAMRSFVANCSDLLTEEVTRKLMVPLESAMAMMGMIPYVISTHGMHLKASAAMVRLRLYDILALLPPKTYEGSFHALLRELVAEFTLTDNPANTTSSLLRSLCHHDDAVLLGSWLQDTDQNLIEDQLQGNSASGSGALEHDPTSVYLQSSPQGNVVPGPLPLGVSVIDAAIALFGLAFPHVAPKHRLQMLIHFAECVKQSSKNAARQRTIQINVFTALICALKGLNESKRQLGQRDILDAANTLITEALASTDPALRCAAGEAVGRMAQVTDEAGFVSRTALMCFEKLKTARDVISRTGHSLALGCVHRYVGGMGSGQHLRTSVGILLALAQDHNSPEVQVWSLHALALIIDAFGPMFRAYVEPTLQAVLALLLSVASSHMQVHRCLGRCLTAIITTLGPELQGNTGSISSARSSCLTSCYIMLKHFDAQVQAESISCLQQLHMFAPRHVELSTLVPILCNDLSSWHLVLRRAAVSCLRQLAQKESNEVCEIALSTMKEGKNRSDKKTNYGVTITDQGLEGALFSLLDHETDPKIISDARDTLNHILHSMALERLGFWLGLCKSVLAASTDNQTVGPKQPDAEEKEDTDDSATFTKGTNTTKKDTITPRWSTRVFAVECVRKITLACRQPGAPPEHFDLIKARDHVRTGGKGDFLVIHLSDLVRLAFMAATDTSAQLRMAGLEALQDVIKYFKDVPEPEFPGAVILEQYQANVGAALRPAFTQSLDSSHEVTARACEVCSAWLASGVVSDLNDLRRVHSLLVSSLAKVDGQTSSSNRIYSESASTMEKLAVLKAWAEVYIMAKHEEQSKLDNKEETNASEENLLTLVQHHLPALSILWIKVLRDQALLRLPREFQSHMPKEGGSFFTPESMPAVRPHYAKAWPPIVHAAALWMQTNIPGKLSSEENDNEEVNDNSKAKEITKMNDEGWRNLHLIMGICVETLCSPRASESLEIVVACLSAMDALMSIEVARSVIGKDQVLGIELLNVIHRLLLTRENATSQRKVMRVASKILQACKEELYPGGVFDTPSANAEGGTEGRLHPGKSVVFASLEVCMCVLVRQFPSINPTFRAKNSDVINNNGSSKGLTEDNAKLISEALVLLIDSLSLCCPKASCVVLPTVLVLVTGVLRECVTMSLNPIQKANLSSVIASVLQVTRSLISSPFTKHDESSKEWMEIFQSSVATVVEFSNEDSKCNDLGSIVMYISLFLLSAPSSICKQRHLLPKILDIFEQAFMSEDIQLQLKCTQILPSIFRLPDSDLTCPFIHRLAPCLVKRLDSLSDVPESQTTLAVCIECFKILELLVVLANEEKREEILDVFMSVLAMFLRDSTDNEQNTISLKKQLHDCTLQYLMQAGQKYPTSFRSILQAQPQMKSKLENAIRVNQILTQQRQKEENLRKDQQAAIEARKANNQPRIKLKMDFSNFK